MANQETRYRVVGRNCDSSDAFDKVLGLTCFITDVKFENVLVAKVLRSPHPHAKILRIDTSRAEKVRGVVAILTARDIPGSNIFGVHVQDRPVLCGHKVRSIADVVALVVAESEDIVEESLSKITVSYEALEAIFTPQEALKKGAPKIHEKGNILKHYKVRKGDVESAFHRCSVIVEGEYQTQTTDGCPLETEAALARMDDHGVLEIWASTQIPGYDVKQIMAALALPREGIKLIVPPIGGGFGAKCEINCQILVGLAALRTGRPVRMYWTREESFRGHQKRHPSWYKVKTGATADGKILALEEEILLDAGAYVSWSLGVARNATFFSTGPYDIPNVQIDAYSVFTNNIHSGAHRGFGAPQAAFPSEMQIEKLAEKLHMDPVEIRKKNGMDKGASLSNQDLISGSVGFRETVDKALEIVDWDKSNREIRRFNTQATGSIRRGIGLACVFKNVGRLDDHAEAIVEVLPERVMVYINSAEIGQGVRTTIAQIAAEALCVPFEKVCVAPNISSTCPPSGGTFASRQTLCSGNAVLAAACGVKQKILNKAAERWDVSPGDLKLVNGQIIGPEDSRIPLSSYVAHELDEGVHFKERGVFRAPPYREPNPETGKGASWYAYAFGAQVAIVEVDIETGEVVVKDLVAVHDVGKAINPKAVEGQIEGGVSHGLGYALMENFILERGQIVTKDLERYPIPTAMDMPLIKSRYVEDNEWQGPFGAKGFAECPVLPTAPAIINAIHNATGMWINQLPATPERVFRVLRQKRSQWNKRNQSRL